MRALLSAGHGFKADRYTKFFDPGCQAKIEGKVFTEHAVNCLVIDYMKRIWGKAAKNVQLFTKLYNTEKQASGNGARAIEARPYDVCFFIHHNACSDPKVNRSEILYYGGVHNVVAQIASNCLALALPLEQKTRLIDLGSDAELTARGAILLKGSIRLDGKAGTRCSLITEGFFLTYPIKTVQDLHIMCAAEAKGLMNALYTLGDMLEKK